MGLLDSMSGIPSGRLANSSVTYVKIQNVSATDMVLGRQSSGAGVIEEIPFTALARANAAVSSVTAGRVLFGNGSSAFNSSANLFWDNSNGRLGVNVAAPTDPLDIRPGNASYFKVKNAGSAYLGGQDAIAVVGSATSNSAGAVQIKANYIGTELEGHQLCSRYGQNGSHRHNSTFAWMHYLYDDPITSTVLNAWEQRILIDWDRSIKFSTSASAATDLFLDKYGRLGLGIASGGARFHIYGTETPLVKYEYAGGGNMTLTIGSTGTVAWDSSGTDSAAYFQFNKRVYKNKQSSFFAYLTSTQNDKTGNGTVYTLGTSSTMTVTVDQNSIYTTSTGTITTASTARYFLSGLVTLTGFGASGCVCRVYADIPSEGLTYLIGKKTNPTTGDISIPIDLMKQIYGSSGINIKIVVTGNGTDTVDILGGTSPDISTYLAFVQVS